MEEITVSSASDPDFANIREEEFELHATYIVQDLAVEPGTANRAEATLPRNLILKPSQVIADVSFPRAARWKCKCKVWCFSGRWCVEHGLHPTGDTLWATRGRNICQRRCAQHEEPEVLLEGNFSQWSNVLLAHHVLAVANFWEACRAGAELAMLLLFLLICFLQLASSEHDYFLILLPYIFWSSFLWSFIICGKQRFCSRSLDISKLLFSSCSNRFW